MRLATSVNRYSSFCVDYQANWVGSLTMLSNVVKPSDCLSVKDTKYLTNLAIVAI